MAEFFSMGGYAGFVWPAYGASAFALIGLIAMIRARARRARARLAAAQERRTPPA